MEEYDAFHSDRLEAYELFEEADDIFAGLAEDNRDKLGHVEANRVLGYLNVIAAARDALNQVLVDFEEGLK